MILLFTDDTTPPWLRSKPSAIATELADFHDSLCMFWQLGELDLLLARRGFAMMTGDIRDDADLAAGKVLEIPMEDQIQLCL